MSALMRPWTERLYQLVDAGVTDREELIGKTLYYVPQGHAFRYREVQNERLRKRQRATDRTVKRRRPRSEEEAYLVGARAVVVRTIRQAKRDGRLVEDESGIRRPQRSACATHGAREGT